MDGTNRNVDWFEVRRKLVHILTGILISFLIYFDILQWWMAFLVLVLGIITFFLYKRIQIPIIHWFIKNFERPEYKETFPGKGALFLVVSVFFLTIFFSKNIIIGALMIWTFGDSISALVGKHYGSRIHPLNNRRLIEGTIAGMVTATIAASFFVGWISAFIASLIAMSLESLELRFAKHPIDDNLLVPLVAGVLLYMLSFVV
jgi:dolichol kinase